MGKGWRERQAAAESGARHWRSQLSASEPKPMAPCGVPSAMCGAIKASGSRDGAHFGRYARYPSRMHSVGGDRAERTAVQAAGRLDANNVTDGRIHDQNRVTSSVLCLSELSKLYSGSPRAATSASSTPEPATRSHISCTRGCIAATSRARHLRQPGDHAPVWRRKLLAAVIKLQHEAQRVRTKASCGSHRQIATKVSACYVRELLPRPRSRDPRHGVACARSVC